MRSSAPPSTDPLGLYRALGVSQHATEAEIKAAYRKLALKWHPDVNTSSDASEVFRAITEAYEMLSDPVKRAAYDDLCRSEQERQERVREAARENASSSGSRSHWWDSGGSASWPPYEEPFDHEPTSTADDPAFQTWIADRDALWGKVFAICAWLIPILVAVFAFWMMDQVPDPEPWRNTFLGSAVFAALMLIWWIYAGANDVLAMIGGALFGLLALAVVIAVAIIIVIVVFVISLVVALFIGIAKLAFPD